VTAATARRRIGKFRPAYKGQLCSLGWRVAAMIQDDLDIDLTDDQYARLVKLYQLDPETGRRLVRRAALRRPKGAGKSPEGGYVGFAELCGPVVFDRFATRDDEEAHPDDEHWKMGQPIGVRWGDTLSNGHKTFDPRVQFAAVSEEQTDNVMDWLYEKLLDCPDTVQEYALDVGKTRISLCDRPGRAEIVSSAGDSREGQRVTFAVLDQTEKWFKGRGGWELAAVLRRNVGKLNGWTYELQNAPEPDDGSVADLTSKAVKKDGGHGVYFDTILPPYVENIQSPESRPALLEALAVAYGEAALRVVDGELQGWVDLERLADEIADPDNDPSDAYRYYLNTPEVAAERAFDRRRWASLWVPAPPAEKRPIVVGFDGSKFDDTTALVAIDVETSVAWLHAIWKRPDHADPDWEVPALAVGAQVDDLFERYNVWRLYGDPAHWRESMATWAGKHGKERVVEWWTNRPKSVGFAARNLAAAIRSGTIHYYADDNDGTDDLSEHVRNAVKVKMHAYDEDRNTLWTIGKPKPSLKIDAAMALLLAWECRNDAMAAGWPPVEPAPFVPFRIR
jgi:hypothetical protein